MARWLHVPPQFGVIISITHPTSSVISSVPLSTVYTFPDVKSVISKSEVLQLNFTYRFMLLPLLRIVR
ncbi:hypothetical protein VP217E381_P0053 [Vibrio phage 217E38-1]|nr:hypothetical protein VP217E381_P0053 [Vibrio phage 217E38-1]